MEEEKQITKLPLSWWQKLVETWAANTGMRAFKTSKHAGGSKRSPHARTMLLSKRKRERQARKEARNRL